MLTTSLIAALKKEAQAMPPTPQLPSSSSLALPFKLIIEKMMTGKKLDQKKITQPLNQSKNELPNPILFGANPGHKF